MQLFSIRNIFQDNKKWVSIDETGKMIVESVEALALRRLKEFGLEFCTRLSHFEIMIISVFGYIFK